MKFTAVSCYQLWTTLLILTAGSRSKGQECSSVEPLVTGNTYRVTDDMITASSSFNSSHTPSEARLQNGDGWCSEQLLGINDPWLEIEFERNVIVYSISVAGNDISYVSEYRIEFAAMEDDEMQFVLTDTEEPKIFNIEGAKGNISSQTLPSPIEAQRLRILPYTWSSNPPCLRLELHGCLLEPACENEVNFYSLTDTLPPENIISSSGTAVPELLQNDTYSCFAFNGQTQPHITLNFTRPVLITRAVTLFPINLTDGLSILTTYVDMYTIETAATDGGSFVSYVDASGKMEILTDRVNTFWQPVQAYKYLRLTITNAMTAFGQVCWHLLLFGCIDPKDSSSDVTLPITTEMYYNPKATKSAVIMLVSTSRILPTVSVYPGGAGDGGVVVEVKKDYLVIEIVVPILVLAVFVVVLVCVIGMIICCRLKRTADYKLKLLTPPAIRYTPADNNSNTTVGDSTIKVVHNSLYSSQVEGNRENTDVPLFPNMSCESAQPTTGDHIPIPQSKAGCEYETLRPGTCLPPNVVPEGYEGVHFIPPGSDVALSAPAGIHEYESIRLSRMTSIAAVTATTRNSGGKPAVLTTSGQSSEYELMESGRHGEEEAGLTVSATNPRYMNVPTPEISVEEGDFSMSVSTILA